MRRLGAVLGLLSLAVALMGISPQPVRASDISWNATATGIEYSQVPINAENKRQGTLIIVRIDPAHAMFRVYYHEGHRKTIAGWARELPGAAIIVNANYFRGNGLPIGLVKIGGDLLNPASGRTDSGIFEMRDEAISIHAPIPVSTATPSAPQPYAESFEGHPFIITNGNPEVEYADDIAMTRARRTVLAQDDHGRILIIVASPIELTLPEMATWLKNSGLGIVTALNLDGGSSSQIHVAPAVYSALEYGASVPVVLAVYAR